VLRVPGQQDEIVFHNLGGPFGFFNVSILIVEVVAAIAYFLKRLLSRGQPWDRVNYLFPALCLAPYFIIPLVHKLLLNSLGPEPEYVIAKYVEWAELCLAIGLCLFAWLVLRLLRMELNDRQLGSTSQTGLTPIQSRKG
jgi:hypothetical protein